MGRVLIYQSNDDTFRLNVRFQDESVWLTQQQMAELFNTTKQNISLHIKSIYSEGELLPQATVKKYLTVQNEGEREVRRSIDYCFRSLFLIHPAHRKVIHSPLLSSMQIMPVGCLTSGMPPTATT